jgi:hypothetical protein
MQFVFYDVQHWFVVTFVWPCIFVTTFSCKQFLETHNLVCFEFENVENHVTKSFFISIFLKNQRIDNY